VEEQRSLLPRGGAVAVRASGLIPAGSWRLPSTLRRAEIFLFLLDGCILVVVIIDDTSCQDSVGRADTGYMPGCATQQVRQILTPILVSASSSHVALLVHSPSSLEH
jgi:hypothetical protein